MILTLDRALARQSYDALAAKLARVWNPQPPDKRRSARSLAGEIRKLARGNATWFLHRPEAARLLAGILGSTPIKLGLVPFEIQFLDARGWRPHATHVTLEEAEDRAWELLTRHGGAWRIRQSARIVARGDSRRSDNGRTATWVRVQREA